MNGRPGAGLNLLTFNMRTTDTTSTLIPIIELCGVNLRTFEPRMFNVALKVIHKVTRNIT